MSKLKNISASWVRLWKMLDTACRKKYTKMIGLSVVIALLEIGGIGLLLHTILSILKPTFIQHNVFTNFLYHKLGLTDQRTFIMVITTLLFVAYLVKNIILVQINKIQVKWAYEITSKVANKHYKYIASRELLYFNKRKSADIVNEIVAITLSFTDAILLSSVMLLSELCIVVMMLAAILVYNPFLFIFTFASIIPAAALLVYLNRNKLGEQGAKLHTLFPFLYENVTELASGIAQIKLWNSASHSFKKYEDIKREIYALNKSVYIKSHHVPPRIYEVVAIAGILCVVLYGVLGDIGSSAIISSISIYAGVSFRLLPSMNRVIGASNGLSTHSYIIDFIEGTETDTSDKQIEHISLQKSLSLKGVTFGYKPDETVLENLSLEIEKGDFVGLVGNSGVGKSTLVNILCSLIKPSSGELLIDGNKLTEKTLSAYQYLFSYVKQDVFMLNASILHNVAFLSNEADEDKVWQCLKKVNLADWVSQLKDGIHTPVGEVGKQVSGGQRQRIAIARALYKNAEIFIFDEVTNNLDAYSTEQTLAAIKVLKEAGKTALFITHKDSELMLCDRVYTLQNKKLVEVK